MTQNRQSTVNTLNQGLLRDAERSLDPALVEYYVRYGNHLRSALIAAMFNRAWQAVTRPFRARPARQTTEPMLERFANGLAAIRSSAEILRDTPDLAAEERARFVSIVLQEEKRLTSALAAIPDSATRLVPQH